MVDALHRNLWCRTRNYSFYFLRCFYFRQDFWKFVITFVFLGNTHLFICCHMWCIKESRFVMLFCLISLLTTNVGTQGQASDNVSTIRFQMLNSCFNLENKFFPFLSRRVVWKLETNFRRFGKQNLLNCLFIHSLLVVSYPFLFFFKLTFSSGALDMRSSILDAVSLHSTAGRKLLLIWFSNYGREFRRSTSFFSGFIAA